MSDSLRLTSAFFSQVEQLFKIMRLIESHEKANAIKHGHATIQLGY